ANSATSTPNMSCAWRRSRASTTSAAARAASGKTAATNGTPASSPNGRGRDVSPGRDDVYLSNSLFQRRFSRAFQPPRCQASEAISGTTVVASANTISSQVTSTLPQEQASFSVEDEQAPS